MSTTDSAADPLVSSIALLLRVPLVELYALLWRVGGVGVWHSDRTAYRSSRARQAPVAACATCPNLPKPGSDRLSRWSPQRRLAEPAPSRATRCPPPTGCPGGP